ncbi:MAG TPA: DUF4397 domain-containing protein, partial [Chitinophagaceae bacterium]|nr:DUF4397 domain-containing protein [Chitinophagaceae bacterium]
MKRNIVVFILLITGLNACDKIETLQDRGSAQEGANIKVMHMSPDAPAFNFMVDSLRAVTVLSNTTTLLESGLAFGSLVPSLSGGYAVVPGGSHTVSAKVPSTSATLAGQTIISKPADLATGKYYTIAIVDSLSKLDVVIIEDNLNVPDTS